MFGEKFKKASKNISVSQQVLCDTRQKMLAISLKRTKRSKYFIRAAVSFACLMVITLASVYGAKVFVPSNETEGQQITKNIFSISAYAYEQSEDGKLSPKEINLSQNENFQGLNDTGLIVVLTKPDDDTYDVKCITLLGIQCKGETIQKVDFKIDSGTLKVPNKAWETEKTPKNLEDKGKALTIDYKEDTSADVYWESEPFQVKTGDELSISESPSVLIPEMKTNITATVYFDDGSQAEKNLICDLAKGSIVIEEAE